MLLPLREASGWRRPGFDSKLLVRPSSTVSTVRGALRDCIVAAKAQFDLQVFLKSKYCKTIVFSVSPTNTSVSEKEVATSFFYTLKLVQFYTKKSIENCSFC
jgi:hypothetical protein